MAAIQRLECGKINHTQGEEIDRVILILWSMPFILC